MIKVSKKTQGFTLIELLIVISIIAILSSVSLVVLNQKRHLGEARNVRRDLDVQVFALGFYQYILDNKGNYPSGLSETPVGLCKFEVADCGGLYNVDFLYHKYITMPVVDPLEDDDPSDTGYRAYLDSSGHIIVEAPLAENEKVISARR